MGGLPFVFVLRGHFSFCWPRSLWSIAISNAWGLSLAVVLMGYGLAAVPRHFWRLANPSDYLQTLYCNVVSMNEGRLSAILELQDAITEGRTEITLRYASTL